MKAVQILARHSDPRLTVGLYSRFDDRDEREAIERTPRLTHTHQRATGTDGWTAKGTGLEAQSCGSVRPGALSSAPHAAEKATGAADVERAKGFEPSTFSLEG